MARRLGPPSQEWKTFLRNHVPHIGAIDMFVVPTVGFRLLYGLVVLRLNRRRLVWINVTSNPTADWIARQITEAFPWDQAPRYLIGDRDASYGHLVTRRLAAMGIRDRPTAPRSPWQNGHVERLIGSLRRECLDHVVVLGEAHLRRILNTHRYVTPDPRWSAPSILSNLISGTHNVVSLDGPPLSLWRSRGEPGP
jgi:transposase InsO family protein